MNGQHWVHKTQHGDKQNKNKTQKTKSATIMNGKHWVHTTQHRDKENKNKTQKTKSAIMNGQHWVHRTQHGDKQNKNKIGNNHEWTTLSTQDTTRRQTK
jgi:hypothetical protein